MDVPARDGVVDFVRAGVGLENAPRVGGVDKENVAEVHVVAQEEALGVPLGTSC